MPFHSFLVWYLAWLFLLSSFNKLLLDTFQKKSMERVDVLDANFKRHQNTLYDADGNEFQGDYDDFGSFDDTELLDDLLEKERINYSPC